MVDKLVIVARFMFFTALKYVVTVSLGDNCVWQPDKKMTPAKKVHAIETIEDFFIFPHPFDQVVFYMSIRISGLLAILNFYIAPATEQSSSLPDAAENWPEGYELPAAVLVPGDHCILDFSSARKAFLSSGFWIFLIGINNNGKFALTVI